MKEIDPITLEVLRGSFRYIVSQMRATLIRTAYSPVIYDGLDFSCGLLSPTGEVVGMSDDFAGHVFTMSQGLTPSLEKFGDQIYPGDVVMMNDPYTGGTHLNDVVFYTPYFSDGRIIMWIAVRAHWQDVGGSTPGSLTGRSKEIFEEGIRIPPVKIMDRGKRNDALWALIFANMRLPEERQGDALAMIDTAHIAEERLTELCERYGAATIERYRDAILDYGELLMRKRISELPIGEYYYEHYIENSGVSPDPLPIKIKLTIDNSAMTFDFSGTAPACRGPINGGPPIAPAGVFVIVKCWLDPKTPVNGGTFRPLKFILPEHTIVKAEYPSAVGACWTVWRTVQFTVIGLFSQVMPELVVGELPGGANHTYIAGKDPVRGGSFILYEYPRGGYSGTNKNDGATGCCEYDTGDMHTINPAEVMEQQKPLMSEGVETRTDGEGAGAHRSAFGVVRKIRVLTDATLSGMMMKTVIPPWGVSGAYAGSLNSFVVIRDGTEIVPGADVPGMIKAFPLKAGDIVVVRTSGGGGWGDPLERDVELVRQDMLNGYLSLERARDTYGVVIENHMINMAKTQQLRQHLKGQRLYFRVHNIATDEYDGLGCRIAPMSTQVAAKIGVTSGDIVDYVSRIGPPLRGWVKVINDMPVDAIPLGPIGRRIVKVEEGDLLEMRTLCLLNGKTLPAGSC